MDNLSVNKRYCSISSARSSPLRFRKDAREKKNRRRENRRNCTWTTHKYYPPKSQIIPSIFQTHLDSNQDFNPKIKLEKTARLCLLGSVRYDPHCMMIKPVEEPSNLFQNFFQLLGTNFGNMGAETWTLIIPALQSNELVICRKDISYAILYMAHIW